MVSASEIARLAYCERQIRLDVLRGARTTTIQRVARRRGEAAHQAFYEESRRLAERSASRGKCFIATLALGETPETLTLRNFRDLFLRRCRLGRAAIAAYYRHSPALCDALADHPRLLTFARCLLRLMAFVAAKAVGWSLQDDKRHGV
jgi:hypothetical protein